MKANMNIHEIPHSAEVQKILAEFFRDPENYWNEERLRFELSFESEFDEDGNRTNDIVEALNERLPPSWVAKWTGDIRGDAEDFFVKFVGVGPNIDTIADEFNRLAPGVLDDFGRYVGLEEEADSRWCSVWALDGRDVGHRIIAVHEDDIPELARRLAELPDGALNDERMYRGMPLFDGLLVDLG